MLNSELSYGDQRINQRYEFEIPLRFSCHSEGVDFEGAGQTKVLSRKSMRFVSDTPVPRRADLEIRIEWPFRPQEVCHLELWVWGRVLKNDEAGTVVKMSKYEFRACEEQPAQT